MEEMPAMRRVRQKVYSAPLADVGATVAAEFARLGLDDIIRPGARIAITAGSRGIDRIPEVLAALVASVRRAGGEPFIIPAMGSHGGATAEGQVDLLDSLGICEGNVGAPVLATMDVEEVGVTPEGIPAFVDRHALGADGILVVNRVKWHADFSGRIESGLLKMITIGLGKRPQAEAMHIHGQRGLRDLLVPIARVKLARTPILAGFALLEDGGHQLSRVVGVRPDEMEATEARLLQWVKRVATRIPFDRIDLLVVDRMGKNVSGTGLDTKVIGRMRIPNAPELTRPRIRVLLARELTPESHGNGVGVGLADIVTRRLVEQIDWPITNTNVWTAGFLERAKLPSVAEDEQEAYAIARYLLRDTAPKDLRVVWLSNTLHLTEMAVSAALLPEAEASARLEVLPTQVGLPTGPQDLLAFGA